ncbi:MAG: hypothetical protein ACN6OD_02775 [Alcaligenes sp.]
MPEPVLTHPLNAITAEMETIAQNARLPSDPFAAFAETHPMKAEDTTQPLDIVEFYLE